MCAKQEGLAGEERARETKEVGKGNPLLSGADAKAIPQKEVPAASPPPLAAAPLSPLLLAPSAAQRV